jgi:alkylation response protein AidB-like acyl-CoA dehydrogenase
MDGLETGRVNIAARAVGVAQAAFDAAIRYAQQRTTFGKPIGQHQAVQFMLADMATKIEAGRLLYLRAAELKDSGERADLEAGMAKLYASEMCRESRSTRCVSTAVTGIRRSSPSSATTATRR